MNYLFIITIINLGLIFLIRALVKKNIFLKNLVYLSFCFQITSVIYGILRRRNFYLVSFEVTFFTLTLVFLTLAFVPIFFKYFLTEKKKQKLMLLEENVKLFSLETYQNFISKYLFLNTYFDTISNKLTKAVAFLIYSNNFFFIFWGPWLFFANCFLLETLCTQKFVISPYLLVYYFFVYRLAVVGLYISKNTAAGLYIKTLRLDLNCFLNLEMLLNMSILKDIVINHKFITLKDKIQAWKNFNRFLVFFVDGKILENYFYIDLGLFKKYLDYLSLSLAFSIMCFYVLRFFFYFEIGIIFFLVIYTILCYLITRHLVESAEDLDKFFKDLVLNLKDFLSHFKWVLMQEHNFSINDTFENLDKPIRTTLPINVKDCLIKITVSHLFPIWFFLICWIIPPFYWDYLIKILINFESFFFLDDLLKSFFLTQTNFPLHQR